MKSIKFFSLILLSGIIMSNCTQNAKNQQVEEKDSLSNPTTLVLDSNEQCFLATSGKDSAFLSIQFVEGKINGTLKYQFFEKDNNTGTFDGQMDKDTLNLNYTFNSEGTTSTRPIKMLISKQQIFEIYGTTKADSTSGFAYNLVDCKN